jgi:hypothetical protein
MAATVVLPEPETPITTTIVALGLFICRDLIKACRMGNNGGDGALSPIGRCATGGSACAR